MAERRRRRRDEDYFRVAFVGKSFVLGAHGAVRGWGWGRGGTAMEKNKTIQKGQIIISEIATYQQRKIKIIFC